MSEHITIGDVSPRALYIANGTQRVFTFAFPIFNDSDLEIRIDGLIQGTGFTIIGAGESDGGLVTFLEAPANGARIMFRRRLILSRMTDFQENSLLRASALNDELDQLAAQSGDFMRVHYMVGSRREYPMDAAHLLSVVPTVRQSDIYICGPKPLVWAVVAAAADLGMSHDRVHHEEFEFHKTVANL